LSTRVSCKSQEQISICDNRTKPAYSMRAQSQQVFVKSADSLMRPIADGRRGRRMQMPADMDDVIEVPAGERREDVRVIVNLPGRYMLASKRNLKGDRCEFACRIVNISLSAMALSAPVPGPIGERVIVYSEQFGRLHGAIMRVMT